MPFAVHTEVKADVKDQDGTVLILEDGAGNRAEVWPALGFNCYCWRTVTAGQTLDLLHAEPDLFHGGKGTRSGIPVLFPFPNRIRAGQFAWEGKDYQLPLTDAALGNAIHGYACRTPWRVVGQGGDESIAWVTGELQLSVDVPDSKDLWPADARLRLTYRLGAGWLRQEAEVLNPDTVPLPFGLGYHPYFHMPFAQGVAADQCTVQVPARSFWKLDHSLPTGELVPVDSRIDLNSPRRFVDLTLDDVLTDLPPAPLAESGLELRATLRGAPGVAQLALLCSEAFREMVVYTPGHRQAFCVEPYTCTTDAINLEARGIDAGWRVLPPGERWTGVCEMRVWLE
jgi:aldose 1-epimerase